MQSLCFLFSLCALLIFSSPAFAFDFGRQVGIIERTTEGQICLAISNPTLKEKEPVKIITLDQPQEVIKATIGKKLSEACRKDRGSAPGSSFYLLEPEKDSFETFAPALAISGFKGEFTKDTAGVRADLNGDGIPESFRYCASSEGLHLTIWAGPPLKGKRLWHEYYYLGYDIEPNCTEKDYAE